MLSVQRIMKRKILVAVCAIILFLTTLFMISAIDIYAYSLKSWNPVKTDAAIVLGAAVWNDKPSPVFRERINHSITLYKAGLIKKIVFTGGVGEANQLSEAEAARIYALSEGVSPSDIIIETESVITEENLAFAKQVARKNGLNTFLVVSDPLHLKRAMLMSNDLKMTAYPAPTPTTRYVSVLSKAKFLLRETYFYVGYLVARQLPGCLPSQAPEQQIQKPAKDPAFNFALGPPLSNARIVLKGEPFEVLAVNDNGNVIVYSQENQYFAYYPEKIQTVKLNPKKDLPRLLGIKKYHKILVDKGKVYIDVFEGPPQFIGKITYFESDAGIYQGGIAISQDAGTTALEKDGKICIYSKGSNGRYTLREVVEGYRPNLSRDGKLLTFFRQRSSQDGENLYKEIWIKDPAAKSVKLLKKTDGLGYTKGNYFINNDELLFFGSYLDESILYNFKTGEEVSYNSSFEEISEDGNKIIFTKSAIPGVFLADLEKRITRQIRFAKDFTHPFSYIVSKEGKKIYFLVLNEKAEKDPAALKMELWVVDTKTR